MKYFQKSLVPNQKCISFKSILVRLCDILTVSDLVSLLQDKNLQNQAAGASDIWKSVELQIPLGLGPSRVLQPAPLPRAFYVHLH